MKSYQNKRKKSFFRFGIFAGLAIGAVNFGCEVNNYYPDIPHSRQEETIEDYLNAESDNSLCPKRYFEDRDGDGYGNMTTYICEPLPGYVEDNSDCNDNDPNTNPGVEEDSCEGKDNNCDGKTDNNCIENRCYEARACLDSCNDYSCAENCGKSVIPEEKELYASLINCIKDAQCPSYNSQGFTNQCLYDNCLKEDFRCQVGPAQEGSCKEVSSCIINLPNSGNCKDLDDMRCMWDCLKGADPEAQNKYLSFFKCGYDLCKMDQKCYNEQDVFQKCISSLSGCL